MGDQLSPTEGQITSITLLTSLLMTGNSIIKSAPEGALVLLDGEHKGLTPLTLTGISQGMHTLVLTNPGYHDISMTVPVLSEETTEFSFPLVKATKGVDNPPEVEKPIRISQGEDLIITELIPLYKQNSRELSFDISIKNQGTSPAVDRFRITYFLSKEQTYRPFMDITAFEYILDSDDISSLDVGKERPSSAVKSVMIPFDIPSGEYWFGVVVDSGDSITETDEENNVKYWEKKINL